jgi:hypothetical protein
MFYVLYLNNGPLAILQMFHRLQPKFDRTLAEHYQKIHQLEKVKNTCVCFVITIHDADYILPQKKKEH